MTSQLYQESGATPSCVKTAQDAGPLEAKGLALKKAKSSALKPCKALQSPPHHATRAAVGRRRRQRDLTRQRANSDQGLGLRSPIPPNAPKPCMRNFPLRYSHCHCFGRTALGLQGDALIFCLFAVSASSPNRCLPPVGFKQTSWRATSETSVSVGEHGATGGQEWTLCRPCHWLQLSLGYRDRT